MLVRILSFLSRVWNLIYSFFIDIIKWIFTPKGLGTFVLIITLIVLILTFQYAHRPYIGIVQSNINYNQNNQDFCIEIIIKNTGNVPANNVQTNVKLKRNSEELSDLEGSSRFVLFPEQITKGTQIFHHVTPDNLTNEIFEIVSEIRYELPIRFLCFNLSRQFKTIQHLRYKHNGNQFAVIAGEYN